MPCVQAISHLLDLFPHLPAPFLRAALVHPTFSSSGNLERATESLVASLLDDAPLPTDLAALRDGAAPSASPAPAPAPAPAPPAPTKPAPTSSPAPAASSRANVHDDDRFFSRGTLLGPKTARRPPPSARASSGGLALDESLKASIIALAEAPSSDEDDDDELDRYGEAFLEGDEDGGPRVKVGDGEPKDGEGSSDDEGGARTPRGLDGPQGGSTTASSSAPPAHAAHGPPRPSAGYGPAVTLTLESAYLAHPEVFARDSATRRGKARKVLKERTGLGDEQIEGWKSMLERDVRPHLPLCVLAMHLPSCTGTDAAYFRCRRADQEDAAPQGQAPRPRRRQQPPFGVLFLLDPARRRLVLRRSVARAPDASAAAGPAAAAEAGRPRVGLGRRWRRRRRARGSERRPRRYARRRSVEGQERRRAEGARPGQEGEGPQDGEDGRGAVELRRAEAGLQHRRTVFVPSSELHQYLRRLSSMFESVNEP